ncbi:MAG TPA: hypothetical protein VFT88_00305 [Acidobacteriaceae bacterium]|nr:hypothetical protein [Acidobacteriaceae bacterium]
MSAKPPANMVANPSERSKRMIEPPSPPPEVFAPERRDPCG